MDTFPALKSVKIIYFLKKMWHNFSNFSEKSLFDTLKYMLYYYINPWYMWYTHILTSVKFYCIKPN